MELGAFSVSLAVKDVLASRQFYEALGFSVFAGDQTQNWLVMKNGEHVIGLFQGMFEGNMLTFNPGWDQGGNGLSGGHDIRDIQEKVKCHGIKVINEIAPSSSGPASFSITDPDGNVILFDQHV